MDVGILNSVGNFYKNRFFSQKNSFFKYIYSWFCLRVHGSVWPDSPLKEVLVCRGQTKTERGAAINLKIRLGIILLQSTVWTGFVRRESMSHLFITVGDEMKTILVLAVFLSGFLAFRTEAQSTESFAYRQNLQEEETYNFPEYTARRERPHKIHITQFRLQRGEDSIGIVCPYNYYHAESETREINCQAELEEETVLAEEIARLQMEIDRILRTKHGYRDRFIRISVQDEATDKHYLEGLRRLRTALEKTRYIEPFSEIIFLEKETVALKNKYGLHYFLSLKDPLEEWVRELSLRPENEPEYQKYNAERKQSAMEKIAAGFEDKPWFPFFSAGRKILCETGGDLSSARREDIEEILYNLTGREAESAEYKGAGEFAPNNLFEKIISPVEKLRIKADRCLSGEGRAAFEADSFSTAEFFFSDPSFKLITEVQWNKQGDKRYFFTAVQKIRQFTEKDGEPLFSPFYPDYLISAVFEPEDCSLTGANIFEYSQSRLQRRLWLNEYGETGHAVFVNREVLPLEEIYAGGDSSSGKSLDEVLSIAERDDRVLVTVIDTGVDYNHPALAYKILRPENEQSVIASQSSLARKRDSLLNDFQELDYLSRWWREKDYKEQVGLLNQQIKETAVGWDFSEEDGQPYDYSDFLCNFSGVFVHGTAVAGVASKGSDDIAILPIRKPSEQEEKFYSAVEYAFRRGSKIVNISLSSDKKDKFKYLDRAIKDHPDILFVIAAGNEGRDIDSAPIYPASFDHSNIIVVAAIVGARELWPESNYGVSSVDVAAQGIWIHTIRPENSRSLVDVGTSLSAAQVTRIAAKIKFIRPELSPEQIKDIIRNSVTPVPELRGKVKYGGIVNEELALELAETY